VRPKGGGCDLTGTPGPDTLVGTSGPDFVYGLAGADRIDGRGGGDIVFAGLGNDRVSDRVVADRRDRLHGCERVVRK